MVIRILKVAAQVALALGFDKKVKEFLRKRVEKEANKFEKKIKDTDKILDDLYVKLEAPGNSFDEGEPK